MTVTVYRSTDASAPSLSGAAGALITVLDAVLVDGYGSKSALGWSKVYSGTNKAVYRAPSGNRLYLRVDDSGTSNARVAGYESMSDVDTGTNKFPTETQISGGLYWLKSTLTDSTARAWIIIGTATGFYLLANTSGVAAGSSWSTNINNFGDFTSFKPSDTYGVRICGNIGTSVSAANSQGCRAWQSVQGALSSTFVGMYIARLWNHISLSAACGQAANSVVTGVPNGTSMIIGGSTGVGGATMNQASPYPNPCDGQLLLSRLYLIEDFTRPNLRGYLPGIWVPPGSLGTPLNFGDTVAGSGELTGKTFELFAGVIGSDTYRIMLETSDTW